MPNGASYSEPGGLVTLRTELRPGDIGRIIEMHGEIYARECGFDRTFEAYVAGPLSEFALAGSSRERIWLADRGGRIAGCVAIVAASPDTAQLRWFLVEPSERGRGVGKQLLREALEFCKESGYRSVILWTVSALAAASHIYLAAGFRKVEDKRGRRWGVDVVEEKYELALG